MFRQVQQQSIDMITSHEHESHARPPGEIKAIFKQCQKAQIAGSMLPDNIVAISEPAIRTKLDTADQISLDAYLDAFMMQTQPRLSHSTILSDDLRIEAYAYEKLPGLLHIPNLLSSHVQIALLERILMRDLVNPAHQTNVHLHHNIRYPVELGAQSFFGLDKSISLQPKDPDCHKPLRVDALMDRKLRWMTLGHQYDWTRKVYPLSSPFKVDLDTSAAQAMNDSPPAGEREPPPFPTDIKQLVEGLVPMKAEAAIVNFYSPGDTLSLHRDVSEMCSQPLVSLSIGCDCTFVAGLEGKDGVCNTAVMTLRSGDAVLMSERGRFAWHGVPKVFADSCPAWMQSFPGDAYPGWEGWMSRKRVNINVRQVFD